MTDKTPELAPCPCCKTPVKISTNCTQFDGRKLRTIYCPKFGCGLSMSGNEPELITAWNQRTGDQAADEWQDISTAPKDGDDWIELSHPSWPWVHTAKFNIEKGEFIDTIGMTCWPWVAGNSSPASHWRAVILPVLGVKS